MALAVTLTVAEWLRGHLLSGFPWNAFGYALTEPLALAQSAALVGVWGLTFLSVAIFATPAVLVDDKADTPHPRRAPLMALVRPRRDDRIRRGAAGDHPTKFVPGVKLRIMQPNLQQDEKFNYTAKTQVMERYLKLSNRATGPRVEGRAGLQHFGLAGIGVSVFPDARTGGDGADCKPIETAYRVDYRRGARGDWRPKCASRALTIRSM